MQFLSCHGIETAQRKVRLLAGARVVHFAEDDVMAAIDVHRVTQISFLDAAIVLAARMGGADILYSEEPSARRDNECRPCRESVPRSGTLTGTLTLP